MEASHVTPPVKITSHATPPLVESIAITFIATITIHAQPIHVTLIVDVCLQIMLIHVMTVTHAPLMTIVPVELVWEH
jgi:hypothetical protein